MSVNIYLQVAETKQNSNISGQIWQVVCESKRWTYHNDG